MTTTTVPSGPGRVEVPKQLVDEVRFALGDDPQSNELVDGMEFQDETLARHLVAVVQDFNACMPVLMTKLTFYALWASEQADLRGWVVEAAAARALRHSAIRKLRNMMPYQAGSVSYDPHANAAALLTTANQMWAEWKTQRDGRKLQMNVTGGTFQVAHSDLLVRQIFEQAGTISVTGGPL